MTRTRIRRATSNGNNEYSVGLVDGGRGDAKGQRGITDIFDDDLGGKQARTGGETYQSSESVRLRKESMDTIG